MSIPIELGENQIEIIPNFMYKITQTDRGISSVMKPLLQVIDSEANILVSSVLPSPLHDISQMQILESSFKGIYAFDYLPNYLYIESENSPSVVLASLNAVEADIIGLHRALSFDNADTLSLNGISFPSNTDFPLARAGFNDVKPWSFRIILKMNNKIQPLVYEEDEPVTDAIVLRIGDMLDFMSASPTGQIKLRYGASSSSLIFGALGATNLLIYDNWYQIVITYTGQDTSSTGLSLGQFKCFLTDLSGVGTIEEETQNVPLDSINNLIAYSGATQFNNLKVVPVFNLPANQPVSIIDIWDDTLDIEDVRQLANHSEVSSEQYIGNNGSKPFVGWAMSNAIGKKAPVIDDYVYYFNNGSTVNPDSTYRFDMGGALDNASFVNEPAPTLPVS
jgi:hypothetical protein